MTMTTTAESYHSTYTKELITNSLAPTTKDDDPSLLVANVTIDELVESCCNEVLSSSSQLNSSSSVSPTHLVRFVHSQASLVSQIDEANPPHQSPSNPILSSHDTPIKQTPLINVTRLPSPFSTLKPKTRIESNNSMHNTTNLTNITANNISVNNYNVNIHTTNVQPPAPTQPNSADHSSKPCSLDEKQTTEIVSQILKNIKEVENNHEQQQQQQQPTATTTTNYNIHIDSFNFSSSTEQTSSNQKKVRVKKEAKALARIIVKDESSGQVSPNFSPTKKSGKNVAMLPLGATNGMPSALESIPVPYGWQRRILASDLVVYLSPTNAILDSMDAVRRYLESPTSCKCGLQCPLIAEKVFNFDSNVKSKSWEVTQVLEGTHCRQKSNILEMATLTNCIDSFCKTEQKPVKRRKRTHQEANNGNVFVCASNPAGNCKSESVVLLNNNAGSTSESGQSMSWTPTMQQTNVTPPSKRPRGRPRKTAITPPNIAQLAVKPVAETNGSQSQPVPLSILSPPASVSSTSQSNLMHRNSTSPSTAHPQTNNLRYMHDNVLTPPILATSSSNTTTTTTATDTHVIARVPSLFDQVKTTTNESSFAVLSGVQNVLLSPNRDTSTTNDSKQASSIVSTTNASGKQVTLNVNALKPDFVRSPAAAQKPCLTSSASNQIDVISLMGTTNSNQLILAKPPTKAIAPAATASSTAPPNHDEYAPNQVLNHQQEQQPTDPSQALMIDFNDPSTTNFLLSALASGASSDSNAIVNHLFQKAQTQQQKPIAVTSPPSTMKRKLSMVTSTGLKNCTETTNLLPVPNAPTPARQSVVFQASATNDSPQQIVLNTTHTSEERKQQHQQIFFINNKPYIIQQKVTSDSTTSQARLIRAPSVMESDEVSHSDHNDVLTTNNNSNPVSQSTLDDGGNCLRLNGAVEPKTLRSLLKGLNPSSLSGVDNLIDTIHRFEHTSSTTSDHSSALFTKSTRAIKASPAKRPLTDKPPVRRRAAKKIKQEEQQSMPPPPPPPPLSVPQPILLEQQQQWQTDFNTFDFSSSWGSDTNLNSLLLNDDFDTAASFDDVNFGDFEPYMHGTNHPSNTDSILPSLFVKPFPPDSLPSVDHLLP